MQITFWITAPGIRTDTWIAPDAERICATTRNMRLVLTASRSLRRSPRRHLRKSQAVTALPLPFAIPAERSLVKDTASARSAAQSAIKDPLPHNQKIMYNGKRVLLIAGGGTLGTYVYDPRCHRNAHRADIRG